MGKSFQREEAQNEQLYMARKTRNTASNDRGAAGKNALEGEKKSDLGPPTTREQAEATETK